MFYPIPFLRKLPMSIAMTLGDVTAQVNKQVIIQIYIIRYLVPMVFASLHSPILFCHACFAIGTFFGVNPRHDKHFGISDRLYRLVGYNKLASGKFNTKYEFKFT
jgi:hypothetical protein